MVQAGEQPAGNGAATRATVGPVALTLVGRQNSKHVVSANVLSTHTKFLSKAKRQGVEDGTAIFKIPNSDPGDAKALLCYIDYISNDEVPPIFGSTSKAVNDRKAQLEEWDTLCRAHLLGTNIEDDDFRKLAETSLWRKFVKKSAHPRLPGHQSIMDVYKRTKANSALRRVLVDMFIATADHTLLKPFSIEKTHDFIYEVCKSMLQKQAANPNATAASADLDQNEHINQGQTQGDNSKAKNIADADDEEILPNTTSSQIKAEPEASSESSASVLQASRQRSENVSDGGVDDDGKRQTSPFAEIEPPAKRRKVTKSSAAPKNKVPRKPKANV